jgi:hypothetical protein
MFSFVGYLYRGIVNFPLRGVFLLFGFMFPSLPRGASLYRFDDSASQRFSFVVGVK